MIRKHKFNYNRICDFCGITQVHAARRKSTFCGIYNMTFILKDSGERQGFETGAVRDTQEGKGRYDLIPTHPLKRLACVYEKGAKKYDDRNWEKGMPLSRFLNSAKRHLDQFVEGWKDEDHLAQAIWNLFGLCHCEEMINRGLLPESLNDLPNYIPDSDITHLGEGRLSTKENWVIPMSDYQEKEDPIFTQFNVLAHLPIDSRTKYHALRQLASNIDHPLSEKIMKEHWSPHSMESKLVKIIAIIRDHNA